MADVAAAANSDAGQNNIVVHGSVSGCLRSVIINLTNSSSCMLINPQVYTYSGYCYAPPDPVVKKWKTEVCSFGHTKGGTSGSVGVLTYDITEDQEKDAVNRLAIMFSVPYDYKQYENWFALGLFESTQACDHSLYNCMYYNTGSFKREKASGSQISFHNEKFILRGTMSPISNAEIKVDLCNKYKCDQ
uniref:Uncharacterized protein n=1 Tax=Anguilla anguilla TaxID=7936 RepID=A0A0E9XYL4_ANGAN